MKKVDYDKLYEIFNKSEKDGIEKDELEEYLKRIEKNYEDSATRTYGNKSVKVPVVKTYEDLTDDEILKRVEDKYLPSVETKKADIAKETEKKTNGLMEKADEVDRKFKDALAVLYKDYFSEKEKSKDKAIKNGLSRSSVFNNEIEGIEDGKKSSLIDLEADKESEYSEINKAINDLSADLLKAMNDIDAEYDDTVKAKVEEMKADRDKAKKEAEDYNAKEAERYDDALTALREKGVDVSEENSKEYKEAYAKKYKALFSYYAGLGDKSESEMDKDEDMIVSYIGKNGFSQLKTAIRAIF